jgi:hypothetical protein
MPQKLKSTMRGISIQKERSSGDDSEDHQRMGLETPRRASQVRFGKIKITAT